MKFKVGNYQVYSSILDLFRLDGGSMFGSVPKVLWEKEFFADEKNRIQLCARALIIEGEGRKILVDVGCGTAWSEKELEIFKIEPQSSEHISTLIPDVTDVILTHLHFDHAGGLTQVVDGKILATFPKAKHWLSRENFERASSPGIREKVSYRKSELEALSQVDLNLIESGDEILPGIVLHNLYGHTKGMSWVGIKDGGTYRVVFLADLCPTSAHIKIPYVMGYDLLAEETMKEKQEVLSLAYKDGALVVFQHDPRVSSGYLAMDNKRNFILHEQYILDEKL